MIIGGRLAGTAVLHQWLQSGLVQADALGFGIRIRAQDGTVLDAQSQVQAGLYAMGHPVRGTIWESHAIPEQVPQAGAIVRAIHTQITAAVPVAEKDARADAHGFSPAAVAVAAAA